MFQASVEQIWAMKAVKYAETHMKVSVILRASPIQFYIAYSTYEKHRERAWPILLHGWHQC